MDIMKLALDTAKPSVVQAIATIDCQKIKKRSTVQEADKIK
tara:strand:+ start:97 stop:219 length:123 start_codon:yes stop_codon:yes gene_type:complete